MMILTCRPEDIPDKFHDSLRIIGGDSWNHGRPASRCVRRHERLLAAQLQAYVTMILDT